MRHESFFFMGDCLKRFINLFLQIENIFAFNFYPDYSWLALMAEPPYWAKF